MQSCSAHYCVDDVRYALQNIQNKSSICQGIEPRNVLLMSFVQGKSETGETQPIPDFFGEQASHIASNIINAQPNHGQNYYSCQINFHGDRFEISQIDARIRRLIIHDLATGEKTSINNLSFPELQKSILRTYIEANRQKLLHAVDVSLFDFSTFLLTKTDLSDIDFTNIILGDQNATVVRLCGGNLGNPDLSITSSSSISQSNISSTKPTNAVANTVVTTDCKKTKKSAKPQRKKAPKRFQNLIEVSQAAQSHYRFKGGLRIGENLFLLTMQRGRVEVQCSTNNKKNNNTNTSTNSTHSTNNSAIIAKELQKVLNTTPAREKAISTMEHDRLPAPLQRLTLEHWAQIGVAVIQENQQSRPHISLVIRKEFQKNIYKTASSHVNYVFSADKTEREKCWRSALEFAQRNPTWKPEGTRYAQSNSVTIDGDTSEHFRSACLFLDYFVAKTQSRIQFVVSSRAGFALYCDLAQLIDKYIDEVCKGDLRLSPIKTFKVFSEDKQVGQSDSAVIYLSAPLNDPYVQKFVRYLEQTIGNRLGPISVIGATSLGHQYVQGTTIPDSDLQVRVTGHSTSSNGGLVSNVLTQAYKEALKDLGGNLQKSDVDQLNQLAQFYAKEIWRELGL